MIFFSEKHTIGYTTPMTVTSKVHLATFVNKVKFFHQVIFMVDADKNVVTVIMRKTPGNSGKLYKTYTCGYPLWKHIIHS